MKAWPVLLALTCVFLSGCETLPPSALKTAVGDHVKVPPFSVSIELDPAATRKLKEAGESIKGRIVFDGDGSPLPGAETAPNRDVVLGDYEFELKKPGTIQISDATISAEAFARLSDKNYRFYINVYSGRRSFKNNVLSEGYADGSHDDLKAGRAIRIRCTLL